jgi:hypothetical protein
MGMLMGMLPTPLHDLSGSRGSKSDIADIECDMLPLRTERGRRRRDELPWAEACDRAYEWIDPSGVDPAVRQRLWNLFELRKYSLLRCEIARYDRAYAQTGEHEALCAWSFARSLAALVLAAAHFDESIAAATLLRIVRRQETALRRRQRRAHLAAQDDRPGQSARRRRPPTDTACSANRLAAVLVAAPGAPQRRLPMTRAGCEIRY